MLYIYSSNKNIIQRYKKILKKLEHFYLPKYIPEIDYISNNERSLTVSYLLKIINLIILLYYF